MNKPKPIAVYSGDTFRNLMRKFSYDKMAYDPQYRREVRKALTAKKAAKQVSNAKKNSPIPNPDTGADSGL